MDRHKGHLPCAISKESAIPRLNFMTLGDAGVGKSCLVKWFCEKKYVPQYITTIGIDYGTREIRLEDEHKTPVKVNFWDTGGLPLYLEVRNEFYKDTHAVLLVFSVANRLSFTNLNLWLEELNNSTKPEERSFPMCLVGNQIDRPDRQVQREEGERFAQEHSIRYFETSAANGADVIQAFMQLLMDSYIHYKAKNAS